MYLLTCTPQENTLGGQSGYSIGYCIFFCGFVSEREHKDYHLLSFLFLFLYRIVPSLICLINN